MTIADAFYGSEERRRRLASSSCRFRCYFSTRRVAIHHLALVANAATNDVTATRYANEFVTRTLAAALEAEFP